MYSFFSINYFLETLSVRTLIHINFMENINTKTAVDRKESLAENGASMTCHIKRSSGINFSANRTVNIKRVPQQKSNNLYGKITFKLPMSRYNKLIFFLIYLY